MSKTLVNLTTKSKNRTIKKGRSEHQFDALYFIFLKYDLINKIIQKTIWIYEILDPKYRKYFNFQGTKIY